MPNLDGTGPDGRGGWCTPLWTSGQISRPLGGVGFGRGFSARGRGAGMGGRGRGRMNMYYATGQPGWARTWPIQPFTPAIQQTQPVTIAPVTQPVLPATQQPQPTESIKAQETGYLRNQIDLLKQQLEATEKRLKELGEQK